MRHTFRWMAGLLSALLVGCLVLAPAIFVLTAIAGTLRSSVWTIGYLAEARP